MAAGKCFCFSKSIGQFTPKIIYSYRCPSISRTAISRTLDNSDDFRATDPAFSTEMARILDKPDGFLATKASGLSRDTCITKDDIYRIASTKHKQWFWCFRLMPCNRIIIITWPKKSGKRGLVTMCRHTRLITIRSEAYSQQVQMDMFWSDWKPTTETTMGLMEWHPTRCGPTINMYHHQCFLFQN